MKLKCYECGKVVDEKKIIKVGRKYYCSEKCMKKTNDRRMIIIWILLAIFFGMPILVMIINAIFG